jgi:hypothetical protein
LRVLIQRDCVAVKLTRTLLKLRIIFESFDLAYANGFIEALHSGSGRKKVAEPSIGVKEMKRKSTTKFQMVIINSGCTELIDGFATRQIKKAPAVLTAGAFYF